MTFHFKKKFLYFSLVTLVAIITSFNPNTVTSLKIVCILAAISGFYIVMNTFTVTIESDSIEYTRKFFSYTKSQQLIPVESIKKFEKNKSTIKLYKKDGQIIHFDIYSPEFISKIEEFSTQHSIPIEEEKLKKNNKTG